MKIRTKITLAFFITALVLTGIAVPVVYLMERDNLENAIFAHLSTTAQSRAFHIETSLQMHKDAVVQLSHDIFFEKLLSMEKGGSGYDNIFDSAMEEMKRAEEADKFALEIFIMDKRGMIVASTDKSRIGLDRSMDAYFLGAKLNPYIKDAYYSEDGQKSMAFSSPIFDRGKKDLLGVICVRTSLAQLDRITSDRTGLGMTGEIYLVNKYGFMITSSRFDKDAFLKVRVDISNSSQCAVFRENFDASTRSREPFVYKDYRGICVLGMCNNISLMDWILLAEIDESEAFLPLKKLRTLLMVILLLVPVVAVIIGNFVSRLIAGPIDRLRVGADVIGKGELDHKVGTDAKDEIGELSRAFDKMTGNLKERTTSIDALNKEISIRKDVQQALQKSTAQMQAILDGSPEVILQVDMDLKVLWANKAALALNPYIVGKPCYQSYVNREEVPGECSCKRAMDIGKLVTEIVYQPAIKDVRVEKCWESIGVPLSDADGRTTGVIVIARDITDRKQAEEALMQSESKYRTLVENIPQKIFLKDRNSIYVSVNQNYARDLKISPDEIAGKADYEFYPRELAEKYRQDDKIVMESGEPTEIEERYIHEGQETWVNTVKTPVRDKNGNVAGILGIFWDISDRKKAEEALRTSEQKFKDLTETTPDWIWEVNKDGVYTYVSPKIKDLLGYEISEVLGKTPFDFMTDEDAGKIGKTFKEIVNNKEPIYKLENTNRHKDGHLVVLETSGIPVFDEKGELKGYRGIDRDITERKEAEEKLKEAMEIKSSFTSMVSHELRTPLAAIKEGIGIVVDGMTGPITDEQKGFLDIAKRNVDRLARLINDVLDFQKLESGRVEFNVLENDVNEVINEVYDTMSSLASEKGLEFTIKPGDNLPRARFDRDKIVQVMGNIVNNAVKFTEKGSITITSVPEGDNIRVSVQDTGPGIRKEDLPRLFHKFEQITPVKDRKPGGTGLGLAISKEIIEKHGGRIWAESEFGAGTTFYFTLPVSVE